MLTPADVAAILIWVAGEMLLPVPADPPALIYHDRSWFIENVCGGRNCPSQDLWQDGTIHLSTTLTLDGAKVAVAHALFHFLEERNGIVASTCNEKFARERQAYFLARKYQINELGLYPQPFTQLHGVCNS